MHPPRDAVLVAGPRRQLTRATHLRWESQHGRGMRWWVLSRGQVCCRCRYLCTGGHPTVHPSCTSPASACAQTLRYSPYTISPGLVVMAPRTKIGTGRIKCFTNICASSSRQWKRTRIRSKTLADNISVNFAASGPAPCLSTPWGWETACTRSHDQGRAHRDDERRVAFGHQGAPLRIKPELKGTGDPPDGLHCSAGRGAAHGSLHVLRTHIPKQSQMSERLCVRT